MAKYIGSVVRRAITSRCRFLARIAVDFFCRFGLLVHDCVVFVMLVALATSVIRFGDKTTRFVVKSCCW